MREKGFETEDLANKTPNLRDAVDKPSKLDELQSGRVDINVLKARAKTTQDKENFKNTIVIIFFLLILGVVGIYLSI